MYAAGKGPGGRYADEREFLSALADAEDDIAERLKAAGQLHDQAVTALDSALDALEAARAMHTKEKCDGCHGRKAAAIADGRGARPAVRGRYRRSWSRSQRGSATPWHASGPSRPTSARPTSRYTT